MKVVYLWKNGQQVLVFSNNDGEYVYPKEKWTEQSSTFCCNKAEIITSFSSGLTSGTSTLFSKSSLD
jgi:uncharacterized membrane protein YqgA involved in biofilm formation